LVFLSGHVNPGLAGTFLHLDQVRSTNYLVVLELYV